MKVTLAYLVPIDEWGSYGQSAKRFAETFQQFEPECEHELIVVSCNGRATNELREAFNGIRCRHELYRGGGRDCGAAQHIARRVDCDFLVCANAGAYFHRAGWLKRFLEARQEYGEGLYGASASYESFPYVAGVKNPHIRTSFFGCNPKTFREFPHLIDSREKCLRFECGDWNFTRWFEERGEPAFLVTWDGCYRQAEFRSPPNVFRKGDQSNLLIRDRHMDVYEQSDRQRRTELEVYANGGPSPVCTETAERERETISVNTADFVSIGMPIYNGGKYLRQALRSLVGQDYPHFELILSDNCSTDETESVCRDFASRDARIRYIRQTENIGSPRNFAFVAQEAKYDTFMWAAHDDTRDPSYIGKCIAKLHASPAAILCCTEVNFIDAEGLPSEHYPGYRNIETLGMSPVERIHELISRPGWFALYGLMRAQAARRISLGLDCYGCDVVLLLELLLQGDFVKVPERLFNFRILIAGKTAEDYQKDFNLRTPASTTPYSGLAVRLLETVFRSQLSLEEKEQVLADFIVTLSDANLPWRKAVPEEILGPGVSLANQEFATLLGFLLHRAVPLDELRRIPLSNVFLRSLDAGNDFLSLACNAAQARARSRPVRLDTGEIHRRAARLAELGRLEDAAEAFRLALEAEETGNGWSDWATVQLARGLTADAERGFRRSVALDPANGLLAAKLGILLAGQGRVREAIPILEQCVSLISSAERATFEALLNDCRSRIASSPDRPAKHFTQRK